MISLGLLFSCHPVNAENYYSRKPVVCGTVEEIVGTSQKFEELPFLRADGTSLQDNGGFLPSQYIIGYNKETQTWSLIEILSTGHACMIATGKGIQIFARSRGVNL